MNYEEVLRLEQVFYPKALNVNPENSRQLKGRKEPSEYQKQQLKELGRLLELADSCQSAFSNLNDFLNLSIVGEKWVLQKVKKADYYTFDIIKNDFHLGGSDYLRKTELRDNTIRTQIRKVFNVLGVEMNDYLRVISAPNFEGRLAQTYFGHLLQIGVEKGWLEISDVAHGFVPKRNIKTNALYHLEHLYALEELEEVNYCDLPSESELISHIKKRKVLLSHKFSHTKLGILNSKFRNSKLYSLNIDMKNFFPSFTKGQVIAYFTKKSNRNVARKIANTVCKNGRLVQGSILSPMITNLLCYKLDEELKAFCKKQGIVYSRYADDMLFSSNERIDKTLVFRIIKILKRFNLTVNPKKIDFNTGLLDCNGLKIVQSNLGLDKDIIRVSKKFYKKTKYFISVYNTKIFKNLIPKFSSSQVTKQGYKQLIQSNLLDLDKGVKSFSNLRSVSLGHLAHIALAKKNVPQGTLPFIERYYEHAKTGLSVIDYDYLSNYANKK